MFCCSLNDVSCTSNNLQLKILLFNFRKLNYQELKGQNATMAECQKISISKYHYVKM